MIRTSVHCWPSEGDARFCLCHYWGRQLLSLMGTAALLVGLASPAAEAAERASLPFTVENIAQGLQQRGFSAKFTEAVSGLLKDNRVRLAKGELPNEAAYAVVVEPASAITDASGMKALVNDGSLLPRADEKQLGLPPQLDETTYAATLDKLFDGAEVDAWLRNADGSSLNSEQTAKYRARLTEERARTAKRLAELKAAPNGADSIADFFRLYNEGKKAITYPSRESYRRLLLASLTLAATIHATPETQERQAPLLMTTAGEYLLLTERNGGAVIRVAIGSLKYWVAPAATLRSNTAFAAIPATSVLQHVAEASLTKFERDYDRILRNGKEVARADAEVAQIKGETAQIKGETVQIKGETVQIKERIAQKEEAIVVAERIGSLSDEIKELILSYSNKKTTFVRSQIELKIGELKTLRQRLQSFKQFDLFSSADILSEMTIAYYRNEIVSKE